MYMIKHYESRMNKNKKFKKIPKSRAKWKSEMFIQSRTNIFAVQSTCVQDFTIVNISCRFKPPFIINHVAIIEALCIVCVCFDMIICRSV